MRGHFNRSSSWGKYAEFEIALMSLVQMAQSPHKKGVKGEVVGSKPIIVCLCKFLLRGNKSVCPQFVFIQFGP